MGYILPINYFQYQYYQDRMKGVKINYTRVPSIEKVKHAYLMRSESHLKEKFSPGKRKPQNQPKKSEDKIYAEITGAGRNFDESI